jgi:hypothetical protein
MGEGERCEGLLGIRQMPMFSTYGPDVNLSSDGFSIS